jgi:hypothetical protein
MPPEMHPAEPESPQVQQVLPSGQTPPPVSMVQFFQQETGVVSQPTNVKMTAIVVGSILIACRFNLREERHFLFYVPF